MKIFTAGTTQPDPYTAIDECLVKSGIQHSDPISWMLVFHSEDYDSRMVAQYLRKKTGHEKIHGGTSCQGVMTPAGFHCNEGIGLGLLILSDAEGSYGVGAADMGEHPEKAARLALEAALENAGRPGELPEMIWINATPGSEERLIEGLEEVVGDEVPIAGGSTGDNAVAGNWKQIAGSSVYTDGVAISVMFPSAEISYSFHSGYDPTEISGRVTKAEGRTIHEIDHRPAAEVYNNWTHNLIITETVDGGNVLAKTTFNPLGREVGKLGAIPYYKLSHLNAVSPDGKISLFSEIREGEEVILMQGSKESLISRAGRVVDSALSYGSIPKEEVCGAIVTYCAGCMLSVQDEMDNVVKNINHELQNNPFLGIFTFGEQGCFIGHENSHGNLMISVVVFANANRSWA